MSEHIIDHKNVFSKFSHMANINLENIGRNPDEGIYLAVIKYIFLFTTHYRYSLQDCVELAQFMNTRTSNQK